MSDSVCVYVQIDNLKKKCFSIIGKTNTSVGIEEGDTCVLDYNSKFKQLSIKDSRGAHTHFVLKNLPIEDRVYITIEMKTNQAYELWVVDNFELRGRREDSWGNYRSEQIQDIKNHNTNKIALLGDWTAGQVDQLSENIKPILPTLRELDIVDANFADEANIDNLLEGAKQLCNVYASDMMPDDFDGTFDKVNPNCLIHIAESAPQQGVNVVKGNYADAISFIDEYPCRIDRQIKFHKASFIKNFPKEIESGYKDKSGGWKSMCLPFYAREFYALDKDGAAMKPFGKGNGGDFDYDNYLPFWIKNTSKEGNFQNWDKIAPNYPYIVSVPNNPAYQDKYRIWGRVSFEGTDEYVWPTGRPKQKKLQDFTFRPNVEGEYPSQQIYTMNEQGSAFVMTSSPLLPFASCLLFDGTESEAPQRVDILNDGAIVASILKQQPILKQEVEVVQIGKYVKISTLKTQKVRIYKLDGTLVKMLALRTNEEQYVSLPPSVYLINGNKIQVF